MLDLQLYFHFLELHYHFVIYALDTRILSLRSYEDFQKEVNLHLIDKAEIVGLFESQN